MCLVVNVSKRYHAMRFVSGGFDMPPTSREVWRDEKREKWAWKRVESAEEGRREWRRGREECQGGRGDKRVSDMDGEGSAERAW